MDFIQPQPQSKSICLLGDDEDIGNDDLKNMIVALRGGIPEKCDFCGLDTLPERMEPEEAGLWICHDCLNEEG